MKLSKIFFDSYKSLLNKELEINYDCIGFVGINESGKSNVLQAINSLGGNTKLTKSDTPKMARLNPPKLRFQFKLSDSELKELQTVLNNWRKRKTLYPLEISTNDLIVTYNIQYDKELDTEKRFFSISGIGLDKSFWILDPNQIIDGYKIKSGQNYIPLSEAIIIRDLNLSENAKIRDTYSEIEKIEKEIHKIESEVTETEEKISQANPESTSLESHSDTATESEVKPETVSPEIDLLKVELIKKKESLEKQKKTLDILNEKIKDFNINVLVSDLSKKIGDATLEVQAHENTLELTNERIQELKGLTEMNETQKLELKTAEDAVTNAAIEIQKLTDSIESDEKVMASLKQPLGGKYTKNLSDLGPHIMPLLGSYLEKYIPRVVYWEHGNKYILESETSFSSLLENDSFDTISRPLVNIFRIGLGIKSISDLKEKISEMQNDGGERTRYQEAINDKVNRFIESVWKDYDQDLKISLERDQVRIQIYDPKNKGASYYNMEERSQGCKTFLSFLLTIGAEAEHEVIKDTILILDEPETHLHPSGVRFMLQELIKISEKNNLVMYATHSIFLIDRTKFDRHIMLKKENENTIIKPSNLGRIGYFMQEEVLYGTLDFDINRDFSSTNKNNFVFEGEGDVILFEHYYDKVLTKETERPLPIKGTSFHQGGKCSDIQKYLINRPLQLGTKWIFILDKDQAANELKKFIEVKYKAYLGKDIFIFQYENNSKNSNELELEDVMSSQFIIDTYIETNKQIGSSLNESTIKIYVNENNAFNSSFDLITKYLSKPDHKDIFKAKFKEVFNSRIKAKCQEDKDGQGFNKMFPIYTEWVKQLIKTINESKVPSKQGEQLN